MNQENIGMHKWEKKSVLKVQSTKVTFQKLKPDTFGEVERNMYHLIHTPMSSDWNSYYSSKYTFFMRSSKYT